MERTSSVITRGKCVLGACVLVSAVAACGSSAPTQQLVDARKAYDDAADGPAANYARSDLAAARHALDRAELAHEDDPGSAREERLARRAEQRAKLAEERGEANKAEAVATDARADARREVREVQQAQAAAARENAAEARRAERVAAPRTLKEERADSSAKRSAKKAEDIDAAALQNLSSVANVKEEPRGIVITLAGSLLFPSGKQELSPIARQNLAQVADALKQQPAETSFTVAGHTDASGSDEQNDQLAEQRAQAVADQLAADGIDKERIKVESHGEHQPIADNASAEGRAANRRVEIVVAKPEKD